MGHGEQAAAGVWLGLVAAETGSIVRLHQRVNTRRGVDPEAIHPCDLSERSVRLEATLSLAWFKSKVEHLTIFVLE